MTSVLNEKDIISEYTLECNFFDIVETEVTGLPVNIYIDNNKNMPNVQYGIWFCISKEKNIRYYSYLDIDGNFYHNIKDFFLTAEDLQKLYIFVHDYSDLIVDLYDDSENFYTIDFKYMLKLKYPFEYEKNKNIYLREYRSSKLTRLQELGTLQIFATGLPMLIWLDNGGTYNKSGHYKRIKFQCNTNTNHVEISEQCSMDLNGNIYNKDKVDYRLNSKQENLLRVFVKNNKYALSAAMENLISQMFFENYCIRDTEYNEELADTFEDFVKWKINNPFTDESKFEDYDIMEQIRKEKEQEEIKRFDNKNRNRDKKNNKKRNF